jgi:hypothetical protein
MMWHKIFWAPKKCEAVRKKELRVSWLCFGERVEKVQVLKNVTAKTYCLVFGKIFLSLQY